MLARRRHAFFVNLARQGRTFPLDDIRRFGFIQRLGRDRRIQKSQQSNHHAPKHDLLAIYQEELLDSFPTEIQFNFHGGPSCSRTSVPRSIIRSAIDLLDRPSANFYGLFAVAVSVAPSPGAAP